jgi:hypothetical protein
MLQSRAHPWVLGPRSRKLNSVFKDIVRRRHWASRFCAFVLADETQKSQTAGCAFWLYCF